MRNNNGALFSRIADKAEWRCTSLTPRSLLKPRQLLPSMNAAYHDLAIELDAAVAGGRVQLHCLGLAALRRFQLVTARPFAVERAGGVHDLSLRERPFPIHNTTPPALPRPDCEPSCGRAQRDNRRTSLVE